MKINSILKLGEKTLRRTRDLVSEYATVVGTESKLVGRLSGRDNYLIHGGVEGECDLEGAIMVAHNGRWLGDITAAFVIIAGEVEGNVTAREKLELLPTARIRGNLSSPVIAMAEGAVYDGKIQMAKQTRLTTYSERRES
jgi:cytoskeletal protein CcmA (bactofilin family)